MSGRLFSLCLCLLGCGPRSDKQAASELTPSAFAYGRVLQLPAGDSPLAQAALPADVYRASRSPDLQDVRVFNARGVEVPYALRTPRPTQTPPEPVAVPLFPIAAAQGSEDTLGLAIDVERSPQGHVLRVVSKRLEGDAASMPISSYLVDARALDRTITGFRFSLGDGAESVVLPLSIASSEDLTGWQALAVEGALLRLAHDGQRVDRDRVEIPPTHAAFYRVRPASGEPFARTFTLTAAVAYPAALVQPAPRERVVANGQPVAARSGVFRFDLGGPVPATNLSLELAEDNTVIVGELFAADRQEGPYERLAAALFYRFAASGKSVSGPELVVPRTRARYYELRVDTTRPGLGGGSLRLITEHAPDQLLFLRRGSAPFTLAYGRHGVARQRFEADDLLALVGRGAQVTPLTATLGAREELGGRALLMPPKPPPPYKTYALWFVLICGVGLLARLAYRLARSNA